MSTITLNNYEAFLLDYLEGNLSNDLRAELELFAITHPELPIDLEDDQLPACESDDLEADFKMYLKKTDLNLPDEAILNYLDKNFSKAERQAFESKLLEDKELASDLELYKKAVLVPDASVVFTNNSVLYKNEDDLVLNNRVIAYVEKSLDARGLAEFEFALKGNADLQKELKLVAATRLVSDFSDVYPDKPSLKKEAKVIVFFNFRTVSAMAAAILLLIGLVVLFNYYSGAEPSKTIDHFANIEKPGIKVVQPTDTSFQNYLHKDVTNNPQKSFASNSAGVTVKRKQNSSVKASETQVEKQVAEHHNISPRQSVVEKEMPVNEKELVAETHNPLNKKETDAAVIDENDKTAAVNLIEESFDDADEPVSPKNSLWKKAVKLAKRANSFGVKSVDGVESTNEKFSLSFHAFSVEKH